VPLIGMSFHLLHIKESIVKFYKRQIQKAKGLVNSAKSNKVVAAATVLGGTVAANATTTAASYAVPAPDYTNFFTGVGVVLGVSLTVMLARKLKSFIR